MHFLRSTLPPSQRVLQQQRTELIEELRRSRWAQKIALDRFKRTNRLAYLAEYNALTGQLLAGIGRLDAIEAHLRRTEAAKHGAGFIRRLATKYRRMVRRIVGRGTRAEPADAPKVVASS